MVLWIIGPGKTIASLFIKNHIKHSILVDGDKVRKYISTDLSYSLKDRKIQVGRVIGLVKLAKDLENFPYSKHSLYEWFINA